MTNLQLNNKYSFEKTTAMVRIPNLNLNNSNDMAIVTDLYLSSSADSTNSINPANPINSTNPTTISDAELNNKIKSLVKAERKLTQNILNHIAEVDKRRLYLKMAYSSLFEYLTKEIGYSAGAAQRRIDAARLIQQVPDVLVKIESGSINLSQISKVQRVFREFKKNNSLMMDAKQEVNNIPASLKNQLSLENPDNLQGQLNLENPDDLKSQLSLDGQVSFKNLEDPKSQGNLKSLANLKSQEVHIKQEVLKKLENQNNTQTDLILAREFNLKIKANESRHIQRDESVRVELTFLKEEMELIRQAQSLLSHKTGGTLKSTLLEMARQVIKKSTPVAVTKKETATTAKVAAMKTQIKRKSITPKLRKEILARDGGCQFKDHTSGKICGSKYFLEIDHIQPKFAQGSNLTANLRVLCKNHNIFRYQRGC